MWEKGVSLVALIVTVIIVILLAAMGGFYSNDVLNSSEKMRDETEIRNIEELVSVQKARIMAGEINIDDSYLANTETINSFKNIDTSILDDDTITSIIDSGKYYYMNQAKLNEVFGDSIQVKDIRGDFLVNFEDKVIIYKLGGKIRIIGDMTE